MKGFTEYIGAQFGNPRGIIGKLCCIIMNTINNPMYKHIISYTKANNNTKILDIGYGNGYLVKHLYKKSAATIYGIDISNDMLKNANKKNKKAVKNKKVNLSIGSCCELNFQDDMFDIITSVNTIYFWDNTVKGLSEIRRTLKEGGIFYNAVYTKEWLQKHSYTKKGFQFFETHDYVKLGKRAGFSKVSIKEITTGKSYLIRYIK